MSSKIKILFLLILFPLIMTGQTLPKGFTFLEDVIPGLIVELNYSTKKNFIGRPINGYKKGQKVIGTLSLAKALSKVQSKLNSVGLGIKIFDAYRPQRAVNDFVSWSKNTEDTIAKKNYYPEFTKNSLFELGYIATKSGHSRGSTVDLTLIYISGEKKGEVLDMGGNWDYFGERSHYNFKQIRKIQRENRKILRTAMISEGFKPYEKEWWHFTIIKEPFPDQYFDFIID